MIIIEYIGKTKDRKKMKIIYTSMHNTTIDIFMCIILKCVCTICCNTYFNKIEIIVRFIIYFFYLMVYLEHFFYS